MAVPRHLLRSSALVLLLATSSGASTLAEAMHDVERLRGLTFLHDVAQRTIDRSEMRAVLRGEIAKSLPYSPDDYVTILRTLQLVDGRQQNLIEKMLDLYQSQVLAFYDPLSHTYFAVRQLPEAAGKLGDVSALQQSVVIHELTHALQDQRFHAAERDLELQRDADAELAYHALLEGEATLVMLDWLLGKSGQSFDAAVKSDMLMNLMAASAAADQMIDSDTPAYFVESLKFPYIEGLKLVVEGYRRGGWKAIDAMHANPPRSTREVLHLSEYFARLDRAEKSSPIPDLRPPTSETLSVEHLGEFHWRFLVGDHATGWMDDRVVIGCDRSVGVETRWESEAKALTFRDAYVSFLRQHEIEPRVTMNGTVVRVSYNAP